MAKVRLKLVLAFSGDAIYGGRIHERTISLRFPGIILRVLRLEVSLYIVYITNQFQTTFAKGRGARGEVKSVSRGNCE
jgi:hypothetical protein